MYKSIVKCVNWVLVLDRLKVLLFILFALLIILVVYSFIFDNTNIIAAYMIGLSALLASTVAMINMINTYVLKMEDEKNKIISVTHNSIVRINILVNKFNALPNMMRGEVLLDKILIVQHNHLYENILSIIIDPLITKDICKDNQKIFYDLHDSISILLTYSDDALQVININPTINRSRHRFVTDDQSKIYDSVLENLHNLRKEIIIISKLNLEKVKYG
ncbi:MAG: hypothetical protein GQ570_03365 [Helicobacteraceae bacterium]|nr:hypothetical protein [Helicobacteraceae bacterium]